MAINRRSIEFNSCDTAVGTNEYSPGGGNTISIIDDEGKEIQGTACVVEQVGGGTLTQAIGEINGNTRTGSFGIWIGSGTWNAVTDLDVITYNGTTQVNYLVPTSYYPANFGFIPVWVSGTNIQAVGMEMTTSQIPNSAGNNYFYDNVTYVASGDYPYSIDGTSSISALAAAEAVKSTGFNQTCQKINGVYNFYAGIVIGIDGTLPTGSTTNYNFSETGETFVIVDIPTMTGNFTHSRWTIRLDGSASNTFEMDSCNYQAGVSSASLRTHNVEMVFSGSAASATLTNSNFLDLDNFTLTGGVTISGGTIRAVSITQGGADISGATIVTQSQVSQQTLTTPTFGTTTGIRNTAFVQGGAGHALSVTGDVTLTGITFSGYGADNSNSAAIVNTSSNDVTITRGEGTPATGLTVRQAGLGGSITVVGPPVNFTLNNIKDQTEVRLVKISTNSSICGVESVAGGVGTGIDNGSRTGGTVTVSGSTDLNTFNFAYQYSGSVEEIYAAIISGSTYEILYENFSLSASAFSTSIAQQLDRNALSVT